VRRFSALAALAFLSVSALVRPCLADSITDGENTVKVGVTELSGPELELDTSALKRDIPQRIFKGIQGVSSRALPSEEIEAYRQEAYLKAVLSKGAELNTEIKKNDLYFFNADSSYDLMLNRMTGKSAIGTKRSALDAYSRIKPTDIPVSAEKSLTWKHPESASLYPAPEGDLNLYCLRNDLDLVVSGRIMEVDTYYLCEIFVYCRVQARSIFQGDFTVPKDSLQPEMTDMAERVAACLAGRPNNRQTIAVSPADADVFIDGAYVGTGNASQDFLKPGEHRVTVDRDGYVSKDLVMIAAPDRPQHYHVDLEPAPSHRILVSTTPDGATVYSGGVNLGTTPLELSAPTESVTLTFKKEGFRDLNAVVKPETQSVSRGLIKDDFKFKELYTKRRVAFYTSLGLFVSSIPAVMITYSGTLSLSEAGAVDTTAYAALSSSASAWNIAFWSASALCAGLLGNAVIQFIPYINMTNY
jgi:hypothetical protein